MLKLEKVETDLRHVWALSLCAVGAVAYALVAIPDMAVAATLGDIGQNLGDNFKQLGPAIKYGAAVGGAVFSATGVKNIYDTQKGQGQTTMGAAATKIAVGVCLLGLAGFIEMSSSTIFGSDQATGSQELGL